MLARTLDFLRKLLAEEEAGAASTTHAERREGLLRGEEGAAMVEFILIFPLQLGLTLTILQFALLQYATLVVQQAADLSARAAAVADVMDTNSGRLPANDAALRMAARQCAILAPGIRTRYNGGIQANSFNGAGQSVPANGRLSWGGNGFTEGREEQAYGLMKDVRTDFTEGQVESVVTYDYLLSIPVGAQFLLSLRRAGDQATEQVLAERNYYNVWRIKRTGRLVAPWVR